MRSPPAFPNLALRVGITGHRWREAHHGAGERLDRADAIAVQATLRTIFARIRAAANTVHQQHANAFTHAAPMLSLVSALAEGADELAASVALETNSGYVLDIVAPYDFAAHSPRFAAGTAALALWERARARLVLDGVPLADEPHPGTTGARHEATLVETNRRLVWNSDIVIAVWDGRDARGEAGTAKVIDRARDEGLPIIHIWANNSSHVTLLDASAGSTDAGDPMLAIDAVVSRLLAPPDTTANSVNGALHDYRRESPPGVVVRTVTARLYNLALWTLSLFDRAISLGGMPPAPESFAAPWHVLPAVAVASARRAAIIDPAFLRADYYATAYASRHRATFTTILFAAPFAVVCAWLGSLPEIQHKLRYAVGELLLLGVLTLFFIRSRRLRFHEKWLDYRLLAERFRHHGFLWLLGRTSPVVRVPTHAVRTDPRPAWVNWWYRTVAREAGVASVTLNSASVAAMRDDTATRLVQEQRAYNERTHNIAHRAEHWLHWLTWLPLSLAIGAAIAHILEYARVWRVDESWVPVLTGFGILGPAFSAALHGFSSQAGFQETTIRTDASIQQLDRFAERLRQIDVTQPLASKAVGDLTLDLADVMGEDLAGWRVDYLARPVNPPG